MSRVLMLLSNGFTHDPRVAAEASSLTRAGHEVVVLAWDRKDVLPEEETLEGVHVVRVRSSLGMRARRYDIFRVRPLQSVLVRRALRLFGEAPFQVIHAHDLDTLGAGARLKARTAARLVYDAHEVFPYLVEMSRARPFAPRFESLERRTVPIADLVIAAGPRHRDYLAPMTNRPIRIVMNTKPLASDRYLPPKSDRMRVIYLGGLEPSRLLVPLAELAVADHSFDVEIGGDGLLREAIRALAAKSSGNLRYLGMVPREEVLPRTAAADVVFSVFDPAERINQIGAPNKLFEALVSGRPILVSRGTWAGDEVARAECGLAIEYSRDGLRRAIETLRDDPALRERLGRNGLRLATERYNWARDEAVLLAAYAELLAG